MEDSGLIQLIGGLIGGGAVGTIIGIFGTVNKVYKAFRKKRNPLVIHYAQRFGRWTTKTLGPSLAGEVAEDIMFDNLELFVKEAHKEANKDDKKKK